MKSFETPARIEPCGIEDQVPEFLTERVVEIRRTSGDPGRGLHPDTISELRGMIRVANAFHSNLIEGRAARPTDIEAALADRMGEGGIWQITREAVAHIRVEAWIDARAQGGRLPEPWSADFIREIHRRLYAGMPDAPNDTGSDNAEARITPGAFRRPGQEVEVGRHLPPSAERVDAFMAHFERRYRGLTRGAVGQVLAIPAAHHRLNYIHPFPDGNGRVSRLMSHAMIQSAGIGGHGLWSPSRGLACGLKERTEYMMRMDAADHPRRGDRDGRGNLSLANLHSFTGWFLSVMLDQIYSMSAMLDKEEMAGRYTGLIGEVYPDVPCMVPLIAHVLRHGATPRDAVPGLIGAEEHAARHAVARLREKGFLKPGGDCSPLRIGFPLAYRERLFPGLFADGGAE